ncbi:MAG: spermidine/putrescine ABC transporter substrate-binding protein [Gammaproteobacteria bacterium]|nr:spermidine/putrescine ABC transporter substrate-binding protein [Gammaproteobacteria bacterium]
MKNLWRYFILLLLCIPAIAWATNKELNLYVWGGYVPQSVLNLFEKQTGIHVNISEYDSNEALYAKIKANPHVGYDIIMPSSYFVSRMYKQGMLRKLDLTKISNLHNLNPTLLNKPYDPGNHYSLPYTWGTTGILVNKRFWNTHTIQHWRDFWQPRFYNKLLLYDDSRDVFAMALIKLGYSINDTNPKHIKQAYQQLRKLLPNIRLFNTGAANTIYADSDITIGLAENGDAVTAQQYNPSLVYIYPKDGFPVWVDSMAIPRFAPHYNNALKFINFILRPDVEKLIVLDIGYSTPNLATLKLLPKQYAKNSAFNPSQKTLKRGEFESDTGKATQIYLNYWQLLKLE